MSLINNIPTFLISMPGGAEWIFIVLAVVLLFGGRKIPELAKGIGKGIRDFKDAKDGTKVDNETDIKKEEIKPLN